MSTASFVQVNVGGFPYSIAVSDIEKFPGSFFECMIKKEWLHDSVGAISIQRDGALFKFVNAYLVNGQLPRDKEGLISLDDFTLDGLKEEADFYGLDALSKECNTQHRKSSGLDIGSYLTIRKYIAGSAHRTGSIEVDYFSNLTQSLKCVWSHFCVRGKMKPYPYLHSRPLYKSTSVRNVNVEELIATATQSPFGRGTETVVDTAVRNSFEIDACLLDASALKAVAGQIECKALAPHLILTFRPYKLVIYKEDGHFDDHRDTVRGDGHIGTLVVILNSTYTGGELQVMHGGRTEVVTGPYNWVAMYGDCLHKINPVTSGTRVSLIYDIYGTVAPTWAVGNDEEEDIGEVQEDDVVQDNGVDNEEGDEVGTQGDFETDGAQSANEIEGISEGDSEADEAAADAYVEYGDEYNDSDDEDEDDDVEYEADDAGLDAFDDDDYDDGDDGYGDDNDYDDEYDNSEEAHHDYWDYWEGQPRGNADPGCPRNPNDADIARVFEALDQDLKSFDTIILCLQHLYPECQTNPAFLKGGDRVLYDMCSTDYEVQVVAATIYRSCDYNDSDYNETKGALFSPAIVKRTLGIKNDSDTEEEKEKMRKLSAAVETMQVKKGDSTAVASRAKLVLPNNLNADSLLDYTPYNDHTGNESQPEESVYIVAGLQVRVKK